MHDCGVQMIEMILGEQEAQWEDPDTAKPPLMSLGIFKTGVLDLLARPRTALHHPQVPAGLPPLPRQHLHLAPMLLGCSCVEPDIYDSLIQFPGQGLDQEVLLMRLCCLSVIVVFAQTVSVLLGWIRFSISSDVWMRM